MAADATNAISSLEVSQIAVKAPQFPKPSRGSTQLSRKLKTIFWKRYNILKEKLHRFRGKAPEETIYEHRAQRQKAFRIVISILYVSEDSLEKLAMAHDLT